MTIYSMGKIQIHQDRPIPPRRGFHPALETSKNMIIGDYIEIDYSKDSVILNMVPSMARESGFKFTQRKVGDKLRIWRVA